MNFRKKVKKTSLYREYAKVLNGILDLSPRELEIFSILMKIDNEWEPIFDEDYKDILSTDNRRKVMRETLVNKNNLSKYVSVLKDKGLLSRNEKGGWEIIQVLSPEIVSGILEITFTLEENES